MKSTSFCTNVLFQQQQKENADVVLFSNTEGSGNRSCVGILSQAVKGEGCRLLGQEIANQMD